MRYVTTCRWNGLDTGREVEIAEEHVSAFAGEIELGLLRRVEAPPGPNVMTASHFLEDGPSWQSAAEDETLDAGAVEVSEPEPIDPA